MNWVLLLDLFNFCNYLFVFDVFVADLAATAVASARAGHHLNVFIGAFSFFDALNRFLNIPKSIAFCHFYCFPLEIEAKLLKV